ncbi:MAG: ribosome maturation factor RimM [Candidatus Neomarinimicrobiota bacterium]|mgnify:FL=1|jgi:16S rRNA processing protein RimM|nr:ribosome maturation factor RimM [Candidatus Neomarinimicrobiota bacterium]|tara:strand:+ start:355 stop:858 length:504 start_codon:yes stop_codon:yes gene_type:complete
MPKQFHPVAEITTTSGYDGEVRLKPLSRFSIEYILKKSLQIGTSYNSLVSLKLEKTIGLGKRMRFRFEGIDSHNKAKNIIGKTIFASTNADDAINLIGSDLLGFNVVTSSGTLVGKLKDVMWLPSNDVYVVFNGEKEFLVPIVPEIVLSVNYEEEKILISSIDGLIN